MMLFSAEILPNVPSIEEQEEQRFHANDGDRLCNSPELKRLLRKHMADNPESSKMNLVNALFPEGDHFFVVCSSGDSVYSAPRSSIFCSSSSTTSNHSCYIFGI
ncbi:ground-like domain protein [Necator americanus]|uniref:Ground-like domain protein n=1 Tax=Necator americanus TaxID=51031 RepID=W2SL95_NECAM|nr:ground-like domain protein [Necator americanus]ETN70293.1 ground-like domain protein [Necator americanus]